MKILNLVLLVVLSASIAVTGMQLAGELKKGGRECPCPCHCPCPKDCCEPKPAVCPAPCHDHSHDHCDDCCKPKGK